MKKFNIKKINLLKKLFIKFSRKLGFEIIDQNNLLVPTSNKKINENLNIFNKKMKVDEFYEKLSKNSYTNYKCKFTNFTNYNLLKACLINKTKNNINSVALIGNSHIQMYVPSFEPISNM